MEGFCSILGDRPLEGASCDMDAPDLGVVGEKNSGAGNTGFFIAGRAGVQSVDTKPNAGGYRVRERSTKPCVGVGYEFDPHDGPGPNYDYDRGDLFNADVKAQALTLGYEYRF